MQTAYCHNQNTLERERGDTSNNCTGKYVNGACPGKPRGLATQYQMQLCKPSASNKEEKELEIFYPAKADEERFCGIPTAAYLACCLRSTLGIKRLAEVSLNLSFYPIPHASPVFPHQKKKRFHSPQLGIFLIQRF